MPATSNIDSTIPLRAQVPEIWGRLNQVQTYKRQQQEVAQGAIDLKERQNVQSMLSSGKDDQGNSILGDDGDPDPQKLIPAITRVAPTTGQQYIQAVQTTHSNKLQLQSAATKLTNEQRDAVSGIVRSQINNPDASSGDVSDALESYAQQNPASVGAVHYAQKLLGHLDGIKDPKQKAQFLNRLAMELQPAGTTAQQQQPSVGTVSTGDKIQPLQTNPQAPGGVQPVGAAMPVGTAPQIGTNAAGQATKIAANGGGVSVIPTTGAGANPSNVDVAALRAQTEQNFANISNNRTAASMAPQQLDQINKALDINKTATTGGTMAASRSNLEAALTSLIPGFKSAEDDATKLQLLDKFSERIAADSARVLGADAKTDAARDSIHRQNANIGYTKEAIDSVLKYAKSQTLAMQAKGDAQEAWIKQSGNGIMNQHDFETAWRQSYDPVLFQLEAADPAEQQKILKGLSTPEKKSLKGKLAGLQALGVKL